MHEVLESVSKAADVLASDALESDKIGRLTDRTAALLRETGIIRLLQPVEFGGFESHPCDFIEAVMATAVAAPSAGWVAGVVGVHPWEIAMMDHRLQEEIWGEDPDTWTSSPYAPMGRAVSVDGGFLFTGQWPYSTGTDHSQWVILGGIVDHGDAGSKAGPPDIRHFVIPRADYEIVEDSWNVMGLLGTGSKDVRMTDVFVPEYRVVDGMKMNAGEYEYRQPGKPLYQLKFPLMFSAAIGAATQGIAQGALAAFRAYMTTRTSTDGVVARTDPNQLFAYGEAAAEISASKSHLLASTAELHDFLAKGGELTRSQRLEYRRDQVRGSRRAVDAIDALFKIAGGSGIHRAFPLERYWRDLQTAHVHICNIQHNIYTAWASDDLTGESNPALFV